MPLFIYLNNMHDSDPSHAYITRLMFVLDELSMQLPHISCSERTQYSDYNAQFGNTNLSEHSRHFAAARPNRFIPRRHKSSSANELHV